MKSSLVRDTKPAIMLITHFRNDANGIDRGKDLARQPAEDLAVWYFSENYHLCTEDMLETWAGEKE